MRKSYYLKIAVRCVALLFAIMCVSNGYVCANDCVSAQSEVKNEVKNEKKVNNLLIIAISCAVWIIGYNFLSSKALLKKTSNEKKALK